MPLLGAPSSFKDTVTFVREAAKPDSLPTGDSEIEEIQAYLTQLQLSAQAYNAGPKPDGSAPRINIFPNEIRFKNTAAAQTYLTRVHNKQTTTGNPPISNETEAELATHIQQVGTLNEAMHSSFSRQNTANFFLLCVHPPSNYAAAVRDSWFVEFDGSEEEQVELYTNYQLWHHTLAVKVKGRTMWIYDPAYDPEGPPVYNVDGSKKRLPEISGFALARDMRQWIGQNGLSLTKVYASGGNNHGGFCREMSCRWIAEEMIKEMDEDDAMIFPIVRDTDWVEIYP